MKTFFSFFFRKTNKFSISLPVPGSCEQHTQDYLGAFILFAAIVTALFASKIYSNATSPSLVALAINYTLLVPIYLNWVVKLSSDLESYIGAVERISQYISDDDDDDRNGDGHAAAAAAATTTTKELQQKKKCKFIRCAGKCIF